MDFSIIFPSRERPELLTNLIESIAATAKNISNVEVLVGVDNDDIPTHETLKSLVQRFPFVQWHSRERSPWINNDYLNWLFGMSTGKFLIAGNDDAIFRTNHWDEIILARTDDYLKDKIDGIMYAFLSDGILNRWGMEYCCFPLISRKGAEAIGYFMPPQYPSWNADVLIWRIYATVGRVCQIPEVLIEHISYHSGLRGRDNVSHHVETINRNCGIDPRRVDVNGEVNNINRACCLAHQGKNA